MKRPILMILYGVGGPKARDLLPRAANLADPVIIDVVSHPRPDHDIEAMERHGVRIAVPDADAGVQAALDFAAQNPVAAVTTLSEQLLVETAAVASSLELPFQPVTVAKTLRSKHRQRLELAEAGLEVPQHVVVHSIADLKSASADIGFPGVLKPDVGGASICTYRVESLAELEWAYQRARSLYPRSKLTPEMRPVLLLEEWVEGVHPGDERLGESVCIEFFVWHGEPHLIGVIDSTPLAPPLQETGHIFPSSLPVRIQAELKLLAIKALDSIGFEQGVADVEIKLTARGPMVIDINGRPGGMLDLLFEEAAHFDLTHHALALALDHRPPAAPIAQQYVMFFAPTVPPEPLVIKDLRGIEQIRSLPNVDAVFEFGRAGSAPDWEMGEGQVLAVVGHGNDSEEILCLHDDVRRLLEVDYAPIADLV